KKYHLQPSYCASLQGQVHIMIGRRINTLVLVVRNVQAARKTHQTIADDDLAVCAEIDDRPKATTDLGIVEIRNLPSCLDQRSEESPAGERRAKRVAQEADRDPLRCPPGEQVTQRRTHRVRFENVVLKVDVMACLPYGCKYGVEGLRTVDQQRHLMRSG